MGFKSLTNHKHLSNNNNNNNYKIGGLIFDSKDDYLLLETLEWNIDAEVELIKDGSYDIEEIFNKIKKVNVTETYYNAREELDGLFKNATGLLQYEGTRFITEYKVGCCFFDKINVIKYIESDDDDYF